MSNPTRFCTVATNVYTCLDRESARTLKTCARCHAPSVLPLRSSVTFLSSDLEGEERMNEDVKLREVCTHRTETGESGHEKEGNKL
jgi:hypothetical protein